MAVNPILSVDLNINTRAIDKVRKKLQNLRNVNINLNSRGFTQPLGRITASADEFTKSI